MDRNLSSGIYICTKCRKNEVVHSQGEPFAHVVFVDKTTLGSWLRKQNKV